MKEIAKRVWTEPAVAIGLIVSLALLVITFITDPGWSTEVILGIIAPLASALGIRQLVTPTAKVDEVLEQVTASARPLQ